MLLNVIWTYQNSCPKERKLYIIGKLFENLQLRVAFGPGDQSMLDPELFGKYPIE